MVCATLVACCTVGCRARGVAECESVGGRAHAANTNRFVIQVHQVLRANCLMMIILMSLPMSPAVPGWRRCKLESVVFGESSLVKHDDPLVQASKAATGFSVTKWKEGQRPMGEPHVYGWAAIVTTLTADQALSPEDKQIATAYMASVSSPEALLQSVYWNQFKKTFQRDWVRWQCSVDSKTQTIMHFIIKAMVSRKAKEKFAQAPAGGEGGNVRELQQMLDDM